MQWTCHKDASQREFSRTLFAYDGNGNCVKRADIIFADGEPQRELITEWRYDPAGRLIELIEGSGTSQERHTGIAYNRFGQKIKELLPDGVSLSYDYDAFGRLLSRRSSDETIADHYVYDLNGNCVEAVDELAEASTKRVYDAANRLVSETLGTDQTFCYQYDGLGRLTYLTLPDGSALSWSFDAARMRTVTRLDVEGNPCYTHEYVSYDLSGHPTSMDTAGKAGLVSCTWDKRHRLIDIQSNHFQETLPQHAFDGVGNLLAKIRHDPLGEVTCSYGYGNRDQLTSENGLVSHAYAYDSLYNRLEADGKTCCYDALNQLIQCGDHHFSYDLRGNRISASQEDDTTHFSYDALGRLSYVFKDTECYHYNYDPFNRRVSRVVRSFPEFQAQPLHVEFYLYQKQLDIGTITPAGTITELYVPGASLGAALHPAVALELEDKTYVPQYDTNGNIAVLVDAETGDPVETYRHSAFGEEICLPSNTLNPWRFASTRCDPETGFLYYGQRYYDPRIGRWLTPDPAGFVDSFNLYQYLLNNPFRYVDPDGRFAIAIP